MASLNPTRVLVRGPNWVGDVVMATPALRAVRAHFPDARIAVLLREYLAPLLQGAEFIDDVITILPEDGRGLRRSRSVGRRLKPMGFDLALLLTNSFSSAMEVFLARIPHRVGFAGDARGLMLTQTLKRRRLLRKPVPRPMVDLYLEIASAVGADSVGSDYTLPITREAELEAATWFADASLEATSGPVVGINPGASFGSSKTWLPDRFAEVANWFLREEKASIYLLGGPGEEDLLNRISSMIDGPHFNSAEKIAPLSILAAVLERMDVLITNDTGPRSVAQAAKTPTVVLAGPMDTAWTHSNLQRSRVIRRDVDCSPCNRPVCTTDHRCMTQIDVISVIAAAKDLLAE